MACPPTVSLHSFSEKLLDKHVHFQIYCLKDSCLIWIGHDPAVMKNLSVAMPNPRLSACPVATSHLMGDFDDTTSTALAERLSKKTKQQVFVSSNLPLDYMQVPLVEQCIMKKLGKIFLQATSD
ncbi:PREDICTED: proteasome assembly chaperone 4-like [Priapulus caudatus]|uniref:Proteasome assembly chaperone 4-like n=1 Tax=Priapulus caudatus TaxID=37621 RepID=A0ABM1EI10_PRICU|nr:PREDICTED: proteasome assembly chaperone 4-like [Priapulus caudatus]